MVPRSSLSGWKPLEKKSEALQDLCSQRIYGWRFCTAANGKQFLNAASCLSPKGGERKVQTATSAHCCSGTGWEDRRVNEKQLCRTAPSCCSPGNLKESGQTMDSVFLTFPGTVFLTHCGDQHWNHRVGSLGSLTSRAECWRPFSVQLNQYTNLSSCY